MADIDDALADAENEGLQKRLQETVSRIKREMGLDTIQVFATVMKGSDTLTLCAGDGNWSARMGQAREWVLRQEYLAARHE